MTADAFLYDAVRTPFGKCGGALSGVRPDDLAALVVRELLNRHDQLDPAKVDEVVFGNANGAGEDNRNVARMAVLLAGLPTSVPGTTINRLCGSSLDAVNVGSRQVALGEAEVLVVGGVESMSRAPWVLPKAEKPYPAGNATLVSTTLGWRLVNPQMPKEWTVSLGEATEMLCEHEGIQRDEQDEFALRSHQAAARAWDNGFYDNQAVFVDGVDLKRDESIRADTSIERLRDLKPIFREEGTVTAGNASPLNDGASAAVLGSAKAAGLIGSAPMARIAGRGAAALDPQYFGFAPVEAANIALKRAGLRWSDVALVRAHVADTLGNLVYRKTARNFGPVMATAATTTIVQVQQVVPVGDLDPEVIITPGIYVDRVVEVEPALQMSGHSQ